MACGCAGPRLRPIRTARRAGLRCRRRGTIRPPRRWPALDPGTGPVTLAGAAQAWIAPIAAAAMSAGFRRAAGGSSAPLAAAAPGCADRGRVASGSRGRSRLRAQPAGVSGQRRRSLISPTSPRRWRRLSSRSASRRPGCGISMSGWPISPGCWRRWGLITRRTPRVISPAALPPSCADGPMRHRDGWDELVGADAAGGVRLAGAAWRKRRCADLPEAARAARQAAAGIEGLRHRGDDRDLPARLGGGAAGLREPAAIAPAFSPIGHAGGLTRAARAWLGVSGVTAEEALATALAGGSPIPMHGAAAHAAMHDAVAPFMHAMPPRPVPLAVPAGPARRRELPGPAQRLYPEGRRSAGTSCSCAPANMTTARWVRSSWHCTRKAPRSAG